LPIKAIEQSPWPGDLTPTLDALTAFDAMRAFLETYWERGNKTSDDLAVVLGNLNRSIWSDGRPSDPAQWDDWKAAISKVSVFPRNSTKDPLNP
jgi:hypothetical protein